MTVPHKLRAKFGLCSYEVRAFPQSLGNLSIDRNLGGEEFHVCGTCDRIYWKDSHYERKRGPSRESCTSERNTSRCRFLMTGRALLRSRRRRIQIGPGLHNFVVTNATVAMERLLVGHRCR